jgi:hypothetical protein
LSTNKQHSLTYCALNFGVPLADAATSRRGARPGLGSGMDTRFIRTVSLHADLAECRLSEEERGEPQRFKLVREG